MFLFSQDLCKLEKTSSGEAREVTKCDINKVMIGKVYICFSLAMAARCFLCSDLYTAIRKDDSIVWPMHVQTLPVQYNMIDIFSDKL